MQYPGEKSSWLTNDSSDENAQGSVGEDSSRVETGESLWSPPQFSLSSLITAVTVFCLACAVIKGFEFDWVVGFVGLAILGTFVWLMVGLYRIVAHR